MKRNLLKTAIDFPAGYFPAVNRSTAKDSLRPISDVLPRLVAGLLIALCFAFSAAAQPEKNLEDIVGPLASRETVRVRVSSPEAISPIPLPDAVPIQLARFYSHVMRDRLGGRASLDASSRVLTVAPSTRARQPREVRLLLKENLLAALRKAADEHAAKGGDALAQWYAQWALWLDGLGIDFSGTGGHPAGTDPLAWAQTQTPVALKTMLANRLIKAIDKVSATPIQLP
jgi:hypothetical protein